MNGIETILRRLDQEAQTQADALLEQARQEVNSIIARYQTQADREKEELGARGRQAAAEREERLVSAAQLEGRKQILAVRQALLEKAYDLALKELLELPEQQLQPVLTELLLQASPQGEGEVCFSPRDRDGAGAKALSAANAKTGGHLTLSRETVPIQGGFILRQGSVEVNCAFETLIRLQRQETATEAAAVLFG